MSDMGIRFYCPHCDRPLNVKTHQAGKVGICPHCDRDVQVPLESTAKKPSQPDHQSQISRSLEDQKTISGDSETREIHSVSGLVPEPKFSKTSKRATASKRSKTAAAVKNQTLPNTAHETIHADAAVPKTAGSSPAEENSFLLDKPKNPWLQEEAPDPLETGMKKVWYIRHAKDGELGPIKGKRIPEMLNKNQIKPDAYIWREDWEDWVRADMVFRQLGPEVGKRGDRVFTDPNCPIPRGYEKMASAEASRKTRTNILLVVAIGGGIVTIGLLGWLLASLL